MFGTIFLPSCKVLQRLGYVERLVRCIQQAGGPEAVQNVSPSPMLSIRKYLQRLLLLNRSYYFCDVAPLCGVKHLELVSVLHSARLAGIPVS